MKSLILIVCIIISCILSGCFITGCSMLSFKSDVADIGINEAGFQTAQYLFKDANPDELKITKSISSELITGLNEQNIETRITITLAEIFKLIAKEKEIGLDKKAQRYINKAIRLLNASIDINQTSKLDAINIYTSYMNGVIEGLIFLNSPKII